HTRCYRDWSSDVCSSDLASGYALDRFAESGDELDLLIGSEGTLAFVTAVQWRLAPLPPHVAGAALGFTSLEAVGAAVPNLVALKGRKSGGEGEGWEQVVE